MKINNLKKNGGSIELHKSNHEPKTMCLKVEPNASWDLYWLEQDEAKQVYDWIGQYFNFKEVSPPKTKS